MEEITMNPKNNRLWPFGHKAQFILAASVMVLFIAGSLGSSSAVVPASTGFFQGLYCASDDGQRHYCNIDTRGGVSLVRQRSGSPCIQGQTWGYDRRGVWVDRGCRADFTTGNSNYDYDRGYGRNRSYDYGRNRSYDYGYGRDRGI